jgi:hypothetical protein
MATFLFDEFVVQNKNISKFFFSETENDGVVLIWRCFPTRQIKTISNICRSTVFRGGSGARSISFYILPELSIISHTKYAFFLIYRPSAGNMFVSQYT